MGQSLPKVRENPVTDGYRFVTCGNRSINGEAFGGEVTAVILAYLALEGPQKTEEMAKVFFSLADDYVKKFQSNVSNLKGQLSERGVDGCLVQPPGQVQVRHLTTDYQALLEACEARDLKAIEELAQGEFLSGLEAKLSSRRIIEWLGDKEAERNRAIWQAFIHSIALEQAVPRQIEVAYKLTSALPSSGGIEFIYLYDLLSENHLRGTIWRKLQEIVADRERTSVSETALHTFVEARRNDLERSGKWQSPLELWGKPLPEEQVVDTESSPLEQPTDLSKNDPFDDSVTPARRRWPLLTAGLIALVFTLWLLLWPLSSSLNAQGVSLLEAERYSDALTRLRTAQTLNRFGPRKAVIPYNLANVLESLGRYDAAGNFYQQAINLDSDLYAAYNNLSRLLLLQEKPEEALRFLERAYEQLESRPELAAQQAFILKNLAWTRYELGSFDTAQRDIDQALSLEPTMAAPYCLAALVAEAKQERGLEHWENCVAYDTGDESVEPLWRDTAQERLASR